MLIRERLEAVPVICSWWQLAGLLRASDLVRGLSPEETPATPASSSRHGSEAPEAQPFRQIACCVDDSPPSFHALATAARLCAAADGCLTVVHAMGSPASGETESDAPRLLDDASREFGARTALIVGHPPTAVARWAGEEGFDLIVAASYRGLVSRLTLGSFARHLAHRAPCSLLLTRPAIAPARPGFATAPTA